MPVHVYEDEAGRRPFEEWFNALPADYATKVLVARGRIEAGHTSGLKPVGGTKHRQQANIRAAQERWVDYQKRKVRRK
jgi:hypothetical protein